MERVVTKVFPNLSHFCLVILLAHVRNHFSATKSRRESWRGGEREREDEFHSHLDKLSAEPMPVFVLTITGNFLIDAILLKVSSDHERGNRLQPCVHSCI